MDQQLASQNYYMQRALQLAAGGLGRTSPNPVVGAVLVNEGKVVGEGLHLKAGEAHAEVMAIAEAGEKARGATLYVTLEPCCMQGRTPACAPQILEAGVSSVVVGLVDPDPRVQGGGIKFLRDSGIDVTMADSGIQELCADLNRGFIRRLTAGRPYVTLKFASSLDGRIATFSGDSMYITGTEARRWVHRERDDTDAIMVGINTVLADDPMLTARDPVGRTPTKIVVDSKGRLPKKARLLQDTANGLIVLTTPEGAQNLQDLKQARLVVAADQTGRVDLSAALTELGSLGLNSVLLEGGSKLNGAMLDAGLVDRVAGFVAPVLLGGELGVSPVGGQGAELVKDSWKLRDVGWTPVGSDLLVEGYIWMPTDTLELV